MSPTSSTWRCLPPWSNIAIEDSPSDSIAVADGTLEAAMPVAKVVVASIGSLELVLDEPEVENIDSDCYLAIDKSCFRVLANYLFTPSD